MDHGVRSGLFPGGSSNHTTLIMKTKLLSIGLLIAFAGAASAGVTVATPSVKNPKNPKNPPPIVAPDPGCDCFDKPGLSVDPFVGGVFGNGDLKDSLAGGVALTGFVNSYLGFSTSVYWWDDGESAVHSVVGSAILRYPIRSACIAPYVLGGVGGHFNSVNQATGHLGGGLEIALPNVSCLGIFADGAYYWADKTDNYTVARLGLRIRW